MEDNWNKFLIKIQRTAEDLKGWDKATLDAALDKYGFGAKDDPVGRGDVQTKWQRLQGPAPEDVPEIFRAHLPGYDVEPLKKHIDSQDYNVLVTNITKCDITKVFFLERLTYLFDQHIKSKNPRFLLFGQRRSGKTTSLAFFLHKMAKRLQQERIFVFLCDWSAITQEGSWSSAVNDFLDILVDQFQKQLPPNTWPAKLRESLETFLTDPIQSDYALILRLLRVPWGLARCFGFSSIMHCFDEFEKTFPNLTKGSTPMEHPINMVLKEFVGPEANDQLHFVITGTDCVQLAYATGNDSNKPTSYASLLTKGYRESVVHLRHVVRLMDYEKELGQFSVQTWKGEEIRFDDFAGVPGYLVLAKEKGIGNLMTTITDGLIQDFDNLKRIAMHKKINCDQFTATNAALVLDLLSIMAGDSKLKVFSSDILKVSGFLREDGQPYVRVALLAYQQALQGQLKRDQPEHLKVLLKTTDRPFILGWYFQDAVEDTLASVQGRMTLVSTRAGKDSCTDITMTNLKRLNQETLESVTFQPELGTFYFDHGVPPENEHLTSRHLIGIDGIHASWVNKEFCKGLVVALQVKLLLSPDQSMIYETLAKFLGKKKTTESQLMTFVHKAFALECPPLVLNLEYIDENNQPQLDTCFEESVEQAEATFKSLKSLRRIFLTADPKWNIDVELLFVITGDVPVQVFKDKFPALHFISGRQLKHLIPNFISALEGNPAFMFRQIVSHKELLENPVPMKIATESKQGEFYFPAGKMRMPLLEDFAVHYAGAKSVSELEITTNKANDDSDTILKPVQLSIKRRSLGTMEQSFKVRIVKKDGKPVMVKILS